MAKRSETCEAIISMIMEVSRRCRQRFQPQDDLTMAQLKAVLFLEQGPSPMSKLASGLQVSLPSATATIDRLVERGLVQRREEPADRRLVVVSLAHDGEALVATFYAGNRAAFMELLNALDDSELRTVL